MGYLTNYTLTVYTSDMKKITDSGDFDNPMIKNFHDYDFWENTCLWEDPEGDMKRYSKLHPNAIFQLHGEGEDNFDIWEKWFVNGKMQVCETKIAISPFDPSQLSH